MLSETRTLQGGLVSTDDVALVLALVVTFADSLRTTLALDLFYSLARVFLGLLGDVGVVDGSLARVRIRVAMRAKSTTYLVASNLTSGESRHGYDLGGLRM